MAELADAHGSGPCDYCSHEGSSPFSCILINDAAEQLNTQEWRNWQTRTVQVRVTIAVMRVQVPFPAPDNDNPNPVPIGDGFGFLVYL